MELRIGVIGIPLVHTNCFGPARTKDTSYIESIIPGITDGLRKVLLQNLSSFGMVEDLGELVYERYPQKPTYWFDNPDLKIIKRYHHEQIDITSSVVTPAKSLFPNSYVFRMRDAFKDLVNDSGYDLIISIGGSHTGGIIAYHGSVAKCDAHNDRYDLEPRFRGHTPVTDCGVWIEDLYRSGQFRGSITEYGLRQDDLNCIHGLQSHDPDSCPRWLMSDYYVRQVDIEFDCLRHQYGFALPVDSGSLAPQDLSAIIANVKPEILSFFGLFIDPTIAAKETELAVQLSVQAANACRSYRESGMLPWHERSKTLNWSLAYT